VHWPTDVLGGYAAGACVLCAGVYWYEGHTGRTDLLNPTRTGEETPNANAAADTKGTHALTSFARE